MELFQQLCISLNLYDVCNEGSSFGLELREVTVYTLYKRPE